MKITVGKMLYASRSYLYRLQLYSDAGEDPSKAQDNGVCLLTGKSNAHICAVKIIAIAIHPGSNDPG